MTKEEYRLKYKELRAQLSDEAIEELSIKIANNALQLPIWDFTNYHLFLSIAIKKEINTEYLLHIFQGRDKTIIVPKVIIGNPNMEHLLLQDNTVLKISNYGVPEPISGIKIDPAQIEVVFIPLLAYDIKGNRLGYGKGYYDRFFRFANQKLSLSVFHYSSLNLKSQMKKQTSPYISVSRQKG